jgi:SAM-dependent methyltransferase
MSSWFEDDAFWHAFRGAMFCPERWRDAVTDVDCAVRLAELAPASAVLDLACGPGRHSLELARRGFRVTGVDRTVEYLEQARTAAARERLDVEWVQADMRAFRRAAAFDAAFSLFTSFGYFEDPDDDRRVAASLFESLRPGGRLVMDVLGKEVLARTFQPTAWSRLADGRLWLQERAVKDDWAAVESLWILIDGGERSECRMRLRLYSAAELRDLLRGVGFGDVACYGSLAGIPYDHDAARLIAVARRPV